MGILKKLNEKIMGLTNRMDKSSKDTIEKIRSNPLNVTSSELMRFKAQTKLSTMYKQKKEIKLKEANESYKEQVKNLGKQKGVILTEKDYEYEMALAKYKLEKTKFNYGELDIEPIRPESELMQNIKETPDKIKENVETIKNSAIDMTNKTKESANQLKENTKTSFNDMKEKGKESFEKAKDKTIETTKEALKTTKHAIGEFVIDSYSRGIDAKRSVTMATDNTKRRVITGYKTSKNIMKMFAEKVKDNINKAKVATATKLSEIDKEAHRRSEERFNKRQEFLEGLKVQENAKNDENQNSNEQNEQEKSDDLER